MEHPTHSNDPMLDPLIRQSLRSGDLPPMPENFTDRLMIRVEKRHAARRVWNEFLIKTLIAFVLLLLISGLIFLPEFSHQKAQAHRLLENRTLLIYTGVIILFTYIADQLVLRYFLNVKKRG